MNEFLQTRQQIDEATRWLQEHNYVTHPISCKDWELKLITESLKDGDLLDMGADGSRVLHNAIKKGIKGRKVGIDLMVVSGDNEAEGAEYFQGDLMHTSFEDKSFDTIVSQSVIEHEVDFNLFAKEAARLLRDRGRLIVSFDYWTPKVNTDHVQIYGLKWNILDVNDVVDLFIACAINELTLTSAPDSQIQDAVINPKYCSPANVSYTFGILEFQKK